jgi:hypothetical protein
MRALLACVLGVMAMGGCVANVSDEDGAGGASMAPGDNVEPVQEVEQALTSLPECQRACRNGQQAMEQFCYGVPDPRVRATCWGAAKAGGAACLGWCYLHYGD